jgi:hypothetical protein
MHTEVTFRQKSSVCFVVCLLTLLDINAFDTTNLLALRFITLDRLRVQYKTLTSLISPYFQPNQAWLASQQPMFRKRIWTHPNPKPFTWLTKQLYFLDIEALSKLNNHKARYKPVSWFWTHYLSCLKCSPRHLKNEVKYRLLQAVSC